MGYNGTPLWYISACRMRFPVRSELCATLHRRNFVVSYSRFVTQSRQHGGRQCGLTVLAFGTALTDATRARKQTVDQGEDIAGKSRKDPVDKAAACGWYGEHHLGIAIFAGADDLGGSLFHAGREQR